MRTISAQELQQGDKVICAFSTKTVQRVEVHSESALDDGERIWRWPGVYVWWTTPGSKIKFRLDATVDVEE